LNNDVQIHENDEHFFRCNENRRHEKADVTFLRQLESEIRIEIKMKRRSFPDSAFSKSTIYYNQNNDTCPAFSDPSCSSNHFLRHSPPAYPVKVPSEPITRWHGMMTAIGFFPFALAIARIASGD